MEPVLFPDDTSFWFETLRVLGATTYGGADIGEVITTAQAITAGDYDSWHDEWLATADRVAAEAEKQSAAGHLVSARDGLLRASNYYRSADFYLHGNPDDPRISHAYTRARESFVAAAGLFDPPVGGGPLRSATRLAVRHRGGGDVNALLVVAWLGQLLGWRPLRCGETPDGGLRFEFDRPDGGSLEAFVIPSAGACDQSAILSIELTSGRDEYVVTREAIDQARVQLPIAPARAVKLDTYSDADICVAALGPRGRDPLFARCLEYAGRLWALEPRSGR